MFIDRDAREWASWDLASAPAGDLEVSFDRGDWHPAHRTGDTIRVLVAGAGATDNPPGTVVLRRGRHPASIRLAADPEVVIRSAGAIQAG